MNPEEKTQFQAPTEPVPPQATIPHQAATPEQVNAPQPGEVAIDKNQEVPFFRRYWPFGLIFVFMPFGVIFGLGILLSGEVFKKTDGVYAPISRKEKITLIIIGVIAQTYLLYRAFNR